MASSYVRCVCGNEYKPAISKTCPKCQRPISDAEAVVSVESPISDSVLASNEGGYSGQNSEQMGSVSTDRPVAQPILHVEKVKLFDTPFYGDKAFYIGGLIVVVMATINAYNTAHTSGIAHTGLGVISGLIDGAVYLGVGFALFCLIPAAIRRGTRKKILRNASPSSREPGQYPDPIGNGRLRFWNGTKWTDQVTNFDFPRKTSGKAVIGGLIAISAVLSAAGILGIQTGANPIKASFDTIGADLKEYNAQTNAWISANGDSAAWAAILAKHAPVLARDANELSSAISSANLTPSSTIDGVSGSSITSLATATIGFVQAVINMNQGFISCGAYATTCYDNVIMNQRNAYLTAAENLQSVAKTMSNSAN